MPHDDKTEHELDLALATELQAALLPKACPSACKHQVAAARNRMCVGVGGDFYNFMRINDDQIVLLIGDVVGHGVRASLIMTQIMGFLRSESQRLSRPVQIISALNEMLIEMGEKIGAILPCSMFYGVIDAPTGTGLFVNAGHPRPLICNRATGSILHLSSTDILLGIEEFVPEELCHTFTSGERLVLFTDGIEDATNPAQEQFGEKRLQEAITKYLADAPDNCAEGVFRAVDEFRGDARQADDETIVVLDRV
ncbi:MAG: PP2C family protein-serine/threonine phosphatase [Phycisphaerae bacterium]|nr:PP2C family protein-serine/threonine phosphatase [Phycisphaerae bacterium]